LGRLEFRAWKIEDLPLGVWNMHGRFFGELSELSIADWLLFLLMDERISCALVDMLG
jgi:hypothetical protein